MTTTMLFLIALVSTAIWYEVSRETMKPSKEINNYKLITLLPTGTLLAVPLTVSLFQNLPFY
ncbi:hypothetical protein [Priestia flexa]|uniref:hypothetical protein n=1 Tax=Priestia flexa TaxID=86664 RepID=UPI00288CE73E|nr:hypothetical protein [Priestia flexa]MDT2045581.1 hypothetical protein [Priestia flexa]